MEMIDSYRPSGPLNWILEKLPSAGKFDLIGASASEERSNAVPELLYDRDKLRNASLLAINDQPSTYLVPSQKLRRANFDALRLRIPNLQEPFELDLFSSLDELDDAFDQLSPKIGENVVLDISALPKRVFFYLIRRLDELVSIRNLIVTYSVPKSYETPLHKNPAGWDSLPSFGVSKSHEEKPMLVVAVGYHHLKLLELIQDREPQRVRLLMPFPSMPNGFKLNWDFVRNIREQFGESHGDQAPFKPQHIRRVNPYSASLAFDHLVGQTANHSGEIILAPFGPKPISLAMALFALAAEHNGRSVSVGYTQPTSYNPNYSRGIKIDAEGKPVVHSFVLKLAGTQLYRLT